MAFQYDFKQLARRVELLCARSEALGREVRRLQKENRHLRLARHTAKEKIRDIIKRLPQYDADNLN